MAGISVYCEALRRTFLAPVLLDGGFEFEMLTETFEIAVGLEAP